MTISAFHRAPGSKLVFEASNRVWTIMGVLRNLNKSFDQCKEVFVQDSSLCDPL